MLSAVQSTKYISSAKDEAGASLDKRIGHTKRSVDQMRSHAHMLAVNLLHANKINAELVSISSFKTSWQYRHREPIRMHLLAVWKVQLQDGT